MQSYIHSPPDMPPPHALIHFLSSPRAHLVDLSYLEPATGRSLLHEAARRKDLRLIDLSIRAGADVFVRDRRGKGVGESGAAAKDEKVKVFLRQCTSYRISITSFPNLYQSQIRIRHYWRILPPSRQLSRAILANTPTLRKVTIRVGLCLGMVFYHVRITHGQNYSRLTF